MSEPRTGTVTYPAPTVRALVNAERVAGFGTTITDHTILDSAPDTTTDEYGHTQSVNNSRVTKEYLEPLLRRTNSRSVLDVGCGIGKSVLTLLEDGFDAYGVDLPGLTRQWSELGCPTDRFFVVAPDSHRLPFDDNTLDFIYSFGVIEHIGTVEGHATRRPDYHEAREHWTRELFRTVRPGGHILLGGPNRNFPFDFSHGLDAEVSPLEQWLSRRLGVSTHRTWGEYFLWSYDDIPRYLHGLPHEMTPLSLRDLLRFGRVPKPLRRLAQLYVENVPKPLLGTGFNPWVMALIRKPG